MATGAGRSSTGYRRKYTGQPYPPRTDRIVLLIKPDHAEAVIFG